MKRRDFFRKLGVGIAAMMVAPTVVEKITEPKLVLNIKDRYTHLAFTGDGKVYLNGSSYCEWNRVLSPDEILELYNCGKPVGNQTIAFWTK